MHAHATTDTRPRRHVHAHATTDTRPTRERTRANARARYTNNTVFTMGRVTFFTKKV